MRKENVSPVSFKILFERVESKVVYFDLSFVPIVSGQTTRNTFYSNNAFYKNTLTEL